MLRGLYDAATGLSEALVNQEVRAANLANANTTGYRGQEYAFGTFAFALDQVTEGSALAGAANPAASGIFTKFEPGPYQQTGNPLDVAISGNGFFIVDGPSGPLYTRNGAFELNADGQLQTKSGLLVRGEGGPITIPPAATRITIGPDGTVLADTNQVGRIQIAPVANPRATLQRVGDTLFQGPPPPVGADLGDVRLQQGFREGSNVQVVQEMVTMLAGLRHYEATDRALRSIAEATALDTRPGG